MVTLIFLVSTLGACRKFTGAGSSQWLLAQGRVNFTARCFYNW
jgi:hypothetical protein